jgi:uncharacterized protein YjbI with pentapeptide repeats
VGRKKPGRKRSQEPQKDIWTTVKENAALVAALIALFGVLITGVINTYIANENQQAQRELEDRNAERQRELEQERAQEAALQTYLTDMGALILDDTSPLREARAGNEVSRLARAKTLTVLLGLDGNRKRILLQFLKDEELVNTPNPIVSLSGADLSYAQLSGVDKDHNRFFLEGTHLARANLFAAEMRFAVLRKADLRQADLSQADLTDADLSRADLSETFLNKANLSQANLTDADLPDADLTDADLNSADLSGADLNSADLSDTDLNGADLSDTSLYYADLGNADLSRADLYGANTNLTNEELKQQAKSLEGATMPNGQLWAGKHVTHEFQPAFSFVANEGWEMQTSETAERIYIATGPETPHELLFTSPRQVFSAHNLTEPQEIPAPENTDEWASWFQEHPALDATKPVPVTIGGASGVRLDVSAASKPETIPLYPTRGGGTVSNYEGQKDRFFILDVGAEMVIIDIAAPIDEFDEFRKQAWKVLDTVEWK